MESSDEIDGTNQGSTNWEEDEDECRVCRGPAEEGNPLFKPCKCSGSIGLIHQECLESWLKIQRGDGRCELCKTPFQFAPQYAEGAPDKLPLTEVLFGLTRRFVSRWLPLMIRVLIAACLWLGVAPVCIAYLYQAWMYKPSVIMERLKWSLVLTDLISGLVVIACVILSFLSLISFADFLREEWQHNGLVQGGERRRRARDRDIEVEPLRRVPGGERQIDNGLWQYARFGQPGRPFTPHGFLANTQMHLMQMDEVSDAEDEDASHSEDEMDDDNSDSSYYIDEEEEDEEEDDSFDDVDDIADDEELFNDNPADDPIEIERERRLNLQGDVFAQNDPPPFVDDPDDAAEVGINIALDEILGIRGPFLNLIQNLLWLLAFHTAFLGFFTFAPRIIGTSFLSFAFNVTATSLEIADNSTSPFNSTSHVSLSSVFQGIEYEGVRQEAPFRLRDIFTIVVGYLASAFVTILVRGLWSWTKKIRIATGHGRRNNDVEDIRAAIEDVNVLAHALGHENPNIDQQEVVAMGIAIGVFLDAIMAVIKVGLLLFMKMFLLPIVLGIALDASTIALIGGSVEDRVDYAGRDLFSSLLLHWVAGITFMLLVTVSVLQLREVMHPGLLAQVIRPQEPQPDLLGNLLHETAGTHARRMMLSLIIYSFLLFLQIYLPVNFLLSTDARNFLSFFELKFCYIVTPQLQVPVELLVFHLCMLAVLERNKNSIGELQHHWMKFLAKQFGLTDALLPREVGSFRLIATKTLLAGDDTADSFWYALAEAENEADGEGLLRSNLSSFSAPVANTENPGETKPNGEKILRFGYDFIRLPKQLPGGTLRRKSAFLPTKFGRYRLKRDLFNNMAPVMQIWEEIPGAIIARPPEGWDDLGAGGADVQGRWAWGREKRSTIERGVSQRDYLYYKGMGLIGFVSVSMKLLSVLLLTWLAAIAFLSAVLGGPLAIGRWVYATLRVPEPWIHDPFGFTVGSLIFFPCAKKFVRYVYTMEPFFHAFLLWMRKFRTPPVRKMFVCVSTLLCWFVLSPIFLGFIYELAFVKDEEWCMSSKPLVENWRDCWYLGCLILNLWGIACATGILSRGFWFALLHDRPNRPQANAAGQADERAAAWTRDENGRLRLRWQGKHGRMASFYETVWHVIFRWDWDKVDSTVLLNECAIPVLMELSWIAFAPPACLGVSMWCFPELSGAARLSLVKTFLGLVLTCELLGACRENLLSWFEVAHKTARDDRYLVGKVLLNYGENVES